MQEYDGDNVQSWGERRNKRCRRFEVDEATAVGGGKIGNVPRSQRGARCKASGSRGEDCLAIEFLR